MEVARRQNGVPTDFAMRIFASTTGTLNVFLRASLSLQRSNANTITQRFSDAKGKLLRQSYGSFESRRRQPYIGWVPEFRRKK